MYDPDELYDLPWNDEHGEYDDTSESDENCFNHNDINTEDDHAGIQ